MKRARTALLGLYIFCFCAALASITLRAIGSPDSARTDTTLPLEKLPSAAVRTPKVLIIDIEGAIGTVTDDRIGAAISQAEAEGAELLVIMLDTPGGFTKPTWSITKKMLNSHVPICVFIAPSGARAGSAGVFITYAAHFAAMASSTNIGAAHVVSGDGQQIDSIMNEKVTNDAAANIKAAAQKRGRNVEWAEQAVRQSVSVTDSEALALNVINVRAENIDELLARLEGKVTETPRGADTLMLAGAVKEPIERSFIHAILELITQPDIAFILFSIGGLGIVLELYNPGAILPGVVGAISLILAFYSFQTLPINYAGLALLILAGILFIAELKVTSGGILTVGGVIALFLGGLMLIDTVDPALRVGMDVLITVALLVGATAGLASWLVLKAHRHAPAVGREMMIGKQGEIRADGYLFVEGALWRVSAEEALAPGTHVEVIAVDGLTLKVKRIS